VVWYYMAHGKGSERWVVGVGRWVLGRQSGDGGVTRQGNVEQSRFRMCRCMIRTSYVVTRSSGTE